MDIGLLAVTVISTKVLAAVAVCVVACATLAITSRSRHANNSLDQMREPNTIFLSLFSLIMNPSLALLWFIKNAPCASNLHQYIETC
jgi:hypothetical protein